MTCRSISDDEAVRLTARAVAYHAERLSQHDTSLAEDLEQEGRMGAMEAARTFDPARGVRFVTYATPRVWGRMVDYLRDHDHLTRGQRDLAKADGEVPFMVVSLHTHHPDAGRLGVLRFDPPHHDPEPSDGAEAEFAAWVRRRFPGRLYPDQIRLLADYYVRDLRVWEIAAALGVSESRASQLMTATLAALLGGVKPAGVKCGHKHSGTGFGKRRGVTA